MLTGEQYSLLSLTTTPRERRVDQQARTVGGRVVHEVNNFKCVSAFSPFLASSKRTKMIHLIFSRISSRTSCVDIMTRKDNDGQVVIGTHWAGFVLPTSSPVPPKNGR